MKRRSALMIFLAIGAAISLGLSARVVAHAAHQADALTYQVFSAGISADQLASDAQFIRLAKGNGEPEKGNGKIENGDKSEKPDLRYVDWSKSSSVEKKGGNGNGNGEDEEADGEEDEGEKEEQEKEEEEGFDRLWDVVLYG
jgi:phosphopantothenoylcysteine synthetase/decarboxylase